MSTFNDNNFIVIQGWMISNLKLKGNDLLIYAIIYGFSQTLDQTYTGSLQYLADWTNSTIKGIRKNLKSLQEKGLIFKKNININNTPVTAFGVTNVVKLSNSSAYENENLLTECSQTQGTKFPNREQSSLTREQSSLTREQSSRYKELIYNNIYINNIADNIADNINTTSKTTTNLLTECSQMQKNEDDENNKIPWKKILEKFNSCENLLSIKDITPNRKKYLSARIKEYGLDAIFTVFEKTNNSSFLTNKKKSKKYPNFKAKFDWIIKSDNFTKIYEGTYDDPITTSENKNMPNIPSIKC